MDTLVIAIISTVLGALLGGLITYTQAELRAIRRQIAEMRALPKRHTYATSAGLEDALAVLLDIKMKRGAEDIRLSQAMEILRQVRGGPHSYDSEKQAGRRPEGWEE